MKLRDKMHSEALGSIELVVCKEYAEMHEQYFDGIIGLSELSSKLTSLVEYREELRTKTNEIYKGIK